MWAADGHDKCSVSDAFTIPQSANCCRRQRQSRDGVSFADSSHKRHHPPQRLSLFQIQPMNSNESVRRELHALALHLNARREQILEAWSRAARQDDRITAATTLSRAQFYDHIPNML